MTTRSVLDQDMLTIRDDILRLGSLVAQAMDRAFDALKRQDKDLAQAVVNDDTVLDHLHTKIEDGVTTTVALQQPMARDLRKLVADLLISNELERMGDHAEGIARGITRSSSEIALDLPAQLPRMKTHVSDMLNQVMDAYVDMNAGKARTIAKMDDKLDEEYRSLFDLLITAMSKDRLPVEQGTFLLWTGHNLERIGDRITNICERIVYANTGDIRDFNPKPDDRD